MVEAKGEEIGKGVYEYISSEDADNRFLKILEKAGIKKRIHENPKVKSSGSYYRLISRIGIAASFLLLIAVGLVWLIPATDQLQDTAGEAEIARACHEIGRAP